MSSSTRVLLVDDGELSDVRALLEEIGIEFEHLRGGAIPDEISPPSDLFIATSRRAMLAKDWPSGPRPARVGIVTEDSNTLRGMLKRIGFDMLIRRPVHPYALRLIILRAIYSGDEKRSERRFALGGPISYRSGFRRKSAALADLSMHGARLLSDQRLAIGARITLQLDKELTGAGAAAIAATVCRASDERDSDGKFMAGLRFDRLKKSQQQQILLALRQAEAGPSQLAEPVKRAPTSAPAPPAAALEVDERAPASTDNRRKHGRAQFEREVVQLGEEAGSVLLGRDISVGGMQIDSSEPLTIGDQLRLAIYGGPREDPFILRASVVREESAGTFGLKFDSVKPAVAERLDALVARLPAVESLKGDEVDALGTVVSRILHRDAEGVESEN